MEDFHEKAYQWGSHISVEILEKVTQSGGYLLRTKIRAAIEYLDQMYQYGECQDTAITDLMEESYGTEIPSLMSL